MRTALRNVNKSDTIAPAEAPRKKYPNERQFPELRQTTGLAAGSAHTSESPRPLDAARLQRLAWSQHRPPQLGRCEDINGRDRAKELVCPSREGRKAALCD